VSACQRGRPNGATGVLSSLGGPGGTGRVGSGRTRGWRGEETDPSRGTRGGDLGDANRMRGSEGGCRSWGGEGGSITLGRVGRAGANEGPVSGGDQAGGGVLTRN
jgi:hypothetical protein